MLSSEIATDLTTTSPSMSSSIVSKTCWGDIEENESAPTQNVNVWKCKLPSSIVGEDRVLQSPLPSHPPPLVRQSAEFDATLFNNDDKYISSSIRLADSLDDLKLYHYIHCDDNTSEDISSVRGIIRCGDNIVCKTFGYTPEIDVNEIDLYIKNLDGCKIYDAEEGATIRVFFHSNKWYLSTHRKIDAYRSKWGNVNSSSFGDMFIDALEWEASNGSLKHLKYESRETLFDAYCDTLDRGKNYTFLVRNTVDNRIVCDAPEHPQVFFIGSFDRSTHELLDGNDSGLNTPSTLNFSTLEELVDYVNYIDWTKKQGVIVYMPNQKQVKVINYTYMDYFNARGNEPSIKFRYLQLRTTDEYEKLYDLYPDYIPCFEKYERVIDYLTSKIYHAYVDRFIKGNRVPLPQPEYFVVQNIFNWYLKDRKRNKISLQVVKNQINSQTPTSLNKMIKPYMKNVK